mmetsp:Transcript_27838/g.47046  ORF Transcript_27838/g.47046 Transcript_27838/m.47046 type:complete len:108 (+) Transcript_27838:507-830(+)|eukprot:CAMPEP_0114428792 /NCGR_PEP_ID=MMETSP0103-20121206/9130_1 /TAXON_ID=37642 ORGANISM="Paraphysomonas imperforata, Strain PA2" /NCGR_SAMPLE_ID=MMETSP0103 /ASSEMBLY_ACC=CAM_ASM_000201 /LENGTH=107 /DNA_ID=CAMNT_0001598063 /DNA_START=1843 /DNA_END=2166 /DNA_ORIENTATION=-
MNSATRALTQKRRVTRLPLLLAAGGISAFWYMLWKKDSQRRAKPPSAIDANYAGYREKVTDYPDRNTLWKIDSKKRVKPPPAIDAEYAGYRERVTDYPDRNKGNPHD